MTAQIIDGKQVAADMRAELKEKVTDLKTKGITPGLAVVLVGEDPASKSYVTAKERACEEIGIYSDDNRLAADTKEEDLLALIDKLNRCQSISTRIRSCWLLTRRRMWMGFTRSMSAKWLSARMPFCLVRRTVSSNYC
jgi:hypothetical protein